MFDAQTREFLNEHLRHGWRKRVVKRLRNKVHPTQVSHVRNEHRWDDRIALAIVAEARAEKERKDEMAKRLSVKS